MCVPYESLSHPFDSTFRLLDRFDLNRAKSKVRNAVLNIRYALDRRGSSITIG